MSLSTRLRQREQVACLLEMRHVEHLAIESYSSSPSFARKGLDHAAGVLNFLRCRCESPIDRLHLIRMYCNLTREPHVVRLETPSAIRPGL